MTISVVGCRYGNVVIQQKVIVTTAIWLALMVLYGTRYTITSTSMYLMASHRTYNRSPWEYCPTREVNEYSARNHPRESLEWTDAEDAYTRSAFYIGYIIMHIPSGIISDYFGARYLLSNGILGCGLVSMVLPFILTNVNWKVVALIQMILGAAQGICMPAIYSLIAAYVPRDKTSIFVAYSYSGSSIGNMLQGVLTSNFVKNTGQWKSVFFIWSGAAFVLYVLIMILIHSRPTSHPFISEKEKLALAEEFGTQTPKSIPWCAILSDSGVWALIIAQFGHTFLLYNVNSYLPRFFSNVLGMDITITYLFIIPNLCYLCFMLVFSALSDHIIRMNYAPVSYVRVITSCIGIVIPNIFLILSTFCNCNKPLVVTCFTLCQMSKAAVFSGIKSNILDLTRNYAGVLQAIQNGIPAVTGMLSPYLIGYMCKRETLQEWRKVFCMSLTICMFTMTLYFVWGEGSRAEWDVIQSRGEGDKKRRWWSRFKKHPKERPV